jgi:predicted nucleic acid-binding Zn ribbon protein
MRSPYLSLGDAIQAFLDQHGLTQEAQIQQVIAGWEQLMGRPIAQHTQRIWFKDGTLYVRVDSPLWKQELQYGRQQIAKTVNTHLGEELVKEVKIV